LGETKSSKIYNIKAMKLYSVVWWCQWYTIACIIWWFWELDQASWETVSWYAFLLHCCWTWFTCF